MALTVTTAKPYTGTLKVTTNTGMQGSTYNPQVTYNPQQGTYNPQVTAPSPQGSYYNPQPAYSIPGVYRPVATEAQRQAQIRAAAAEAARKAAIAAELERQRVIKVKTAEHNNRLSIFRGKLSANVAVAKAKQFLMTMANRRGHWSEYFDSQGKLWGGEDYDENTAPLRVREAHAAYQKATSIDGGGTSDDELNELYKSVKSKFRVKASDLIKQRKKGYVWDEATGRWQAQSMQGDLQHNIGSYNVKLKSYEKERGQKYQAWLSAKNSGNVALQNKLAAEFTSWDTKQVRTLVHMGAALEGLSEGYGREANSPLRGKFSDVVNTTTDIAGKVGDAAGAVFKALSIPNRAFTTAAVKLGETKIHKHDGKVETVNPNAPLSEIWKKTENVRSLNRVAPKFKSEADYLKLLYGKLKPSKPFDQWKKEPSVKKYYVEQVRRFQAGDATADFLTDPIMALPGLRPVGKVLEHIKDAAKGTKVWNKAAESSVGKVVGWLGQEYKTPAVKHMEAIDNYAKVRKAAQTKYWPTYQKLVTKIRGNTVDFRAIDEIKSLTDKEAAILQRMRGLDKFSRRDTLWLRNNPILRNKLLTLHQRVQGTMENSRLADKVASTRFKGKYYSHGWNPSGAKDVYDFRKFRKNKHTLSAADLHAAQVERLFMGNLEGGQLVKGLPRLKKKAQEISDLHTRELDEARTVVEKAIKNRSWKKELPRKLASLPMDAWRAAVLPLRPAWYANNAVYNEIGGALSAGPRFFLEQAKLLKPGALKAARLEHPQVVSRLSQYHKGNWLYRPATAIEDNARLAAFKANKKRGLGDKSSLKRTNDYLLDYSTKNWERPIKGVLPFWAWTKGITKATAKMPFDRPGAANALSTYDEKTQYELDKLPPEQRKYYESGIYVGKDKDGNPKFQNAPWNPFTTRNSKNIGINPYLSALKEFLNNKDYYGNELDDKSLFGTLKTKFPQVGLTEAFGSGRKTDLQYFSERGKDGFAFTKQQTKDTTGKFGKLLKSYFGWNDPKTFDWKRFNKNNNNKKFLKEWFGHDWDNEFTVDQWNEKRAAQKAIAEKYGFDLNKDVYNGLFSKNDTPTTKSVKAKKDEAAQWADRFWTEYQKQPFGTRSRWANQKMKELEASGELADNAFIWDKLPKWHSAETATKYSKPSTAVQYKGKWFKNSSSLERYKRYEAYKSGNWSYFGTHKRTSASKSSPYTFDGKFFKSAASMTKYKEGKFWKEYYATNDYAERQRLLSAHPQYRSFDLPKSKEEWDIFKKTNKAKQKARALTLPGWEAAFSRYVQNAPKRTKFSLSKKIVWKS